MLLDEKMDVTRYMTRLLILRGVTLASFAGLIAYALAMTTQQLNQPVLGLLFLLALLFSLHPAWALTHKQHIGDRQLLMQIGLDILLLSALLFYTGGYTNPLISLYLFPVLVAGLTLSRRHAWIIAGITILAYTLLMRFYLPLFSMHEQSMISHDFELHLLGMWLTFVLSIILLISVIVRMSEQRREREKQLADWQQRSIRDHAILALGAQAASDAHELGTPLNTLLLLTDELAAANLEQQNRQHVDMMQQQLLHCRHVLSRLSQRARTLSNGCIEPIATIEMIKNAMAQWRNLHPDIQLDLQGAITNQCMADPMLEQAVFILLDNAADAGATDVQLELASNQHHTTLTVCDNGSGFIEAVLDVVGSEAVSSKAHGKGLGLYLVRFIVEQMHGSVCFDNQQHGGARVILQWPVPVHDKAANWCTKP